ncbi:serine/threonine-protein kinase, partial [Thermogemmatispora sp.]|uniref:serine/threonine protein kinase n=1 Tax=Thermogemmatispora sp. TaxID=1968838 RepID=UPI002ACC0D0E
MRERNRYIDRVIGHYRVIAGLGNRPASSTYLAQHLTAPGHTVVIKFFHPPFPRNREQYFREVRLLRMLRHPHLLPPLECGIDQDEVYLMSEYALRGSLRQRLARQGMTPLSLAETGALLQQVADALAYAHHFNVMHGNLKPENILFNTRGELWLTDFSWATATDGEPELRPGSWPYMAPEQFTGVTTRASDQYALACIAYELLTGRPPFSGTDFTTLAHQHAHEQPVAPTQLNLLLPRRVDEVLLQALAKESDRRFADVKDFMAALFPSSSSTAAGSLPAPATSNVPGLPAPGRRAQLFPVEFSPVRGELLRPSDAGRGQESAQTTDAAASPGPQPSMSPEPAASSNSESGSAHGHHGQAETLTSGTLTEEETSIYEQETLPYPSLSFQGQTPSSPDQGQRATPLSSGEGHLSRELAPTTGALAGALEEEQLPESPRQAVLWSPSEAPRAEPEQAEMASQRTNEPAALAAAASSLPWNEEATVISESIRPAFSSAARSASPGARGSQDRRYWREARQGRWILMGVASLIVLLSLLIILLLPLLSAGLWRQSAQQTPIITTSTVAVTVNPTPMPTPSPTPTPT